MAQSSKIFRLFVSSTFSDMVAERNALQQYLFPKLRKFCASEGARFQAIDLRWGISHEAGLSQRATAICLSEIARCQRTTRSPNFLLLMGDRYGWQPLPEIIPADEWDLLISQISDNTILYLMNTWYRRDNNAVPPVYVLQPRTGKYEKQDAWTEVEQTIRAELEQTVGHTGWSREKRLKYETSVTEQEIEAGIFQYPHASDGAFCFFRTLDPKPENATGYIDADFGARTKLDRLKERLKEHLPEDNIRSYSGIWEGERVTINTESFCKLVEDTLMTAIEAELKTSRAKSSLELEQSVHHTFVVEHTQHFVGRTDSLARISSYMDPDSQLQKPPIEKKVPVWTRLTDKKHNPADKVRRDLPENNSPLVVYGVSGVGKSTVIAQAIQQVAVLHPQAKILYRFIGITPDSSSLQTLLVSLCKDIAHRYGKEDNVLPDDNDVIRALPNYLAMATPESPLIIFLDALDQLQTSGYPSNLSWLPSQLPPQVKLILSCTPDDYLKELRRRLPESAFLEIVPLKKAFAESLLDSWLYEAGRRLEPAQRIEVLSKFSTNGLPLYLKLAFEEARLWHSYTTDITLQPDILLLLRDNLFERLAHPAEHGEMLVVHSLSYLGASRNGLSENEILEILTRDDKFWMDFETRAHPDHRNALKLVHQLPMAVWSRLYFDLRPYLVERATDDTLLLTFNHRQFGEAVSAHYLSENFEFERHRHLANYFESQPIDSRRMAELPWQLQKVREWQRLKETLANIRYMQHMWTHNKSEVMGFWSEVLNALDIPLSQIYQTDWAGLLRKAEDLQSIGDLVFTMGCPDEAETVYSTLIERYRQENNPALLVGALEGLISILSNRGEYDVPQLEECLAIYNKLGDKRRYSMCLTRMAGAQLRNDPDHRKAFRLLDEQEKLARELDDQESLQACLGNQANLYHMQKNLDTAMQLRIQGENICQQSGFFPELQEHRLNRAILLKDQKHWRSALDLLAQTEADCRRLNLATHLCSVLGQQANILADHGQRTEAIEKNEEAEQLFRQTKNFVQLANCLINQARVYSQIGNKDMMSRKAEEALSLIIELDLGGEHRSICAKYIKIASTGRTGNCPQCDGATIVFHERCICTECGRMGIARESRGRMYCG